jgi:hypothetical protein
VNSASAPPVIDQPPPTRAKRLWLKVLLAVMGAIGVLIACGAAWYRHTCPYGWSHCCSGQIDLALRMYADDNGGWLPHGQATPEASLSLLAKDNLYLSDIFRGKTLPLQVVEEALKRDGVLGPNSCGWHYIEGLNEEDNPEIVVGWDKVEGLGHNGDYHAGLAHEVLSLYGRQSYIGKQERPAFVERQKRLIAETMAKRTKGDPPIRWSDEATLGPNVNRPRLVPIGSASATPTNNPKNNP